MLLGFKNSLSQVLVNGVYPQQHGQRLLALAYLCVQALISSNRYNRRWSGLQQTLKAFFINRDIYRILLLNFLSYQSDSCKN